MQLLLTGTVALPQAVDAADGELLLKAVVIPPVSPNWLATLTCSIWVSSVFHCVLNEKCSRLVLSMLYCVVICESCEMRDA